VREEDPCSVITGGVISMMGWLGLKVVFPPQATSSEIKLAINRVRIEEPLGIDAA
jgi:hypothetical protein